MEKPVVGVLPLCDEKRQSFWMLPGYLEGIQQAGGIPVTLPFAGEDGDIKELLLLCDGFLFTGGQDVDPGLYGEKPISDRVVPCRERDALEKKILAGAISRDKPVLGICRGIQSLNAALGGTLWQDLPT